MRPGGGKAPRLRTVEKEVCRCRMQGKDRQTVRTELRRPTQSDASYSRL